MITQDWPDGGNNRKVLMDNYKRKGKIGKFSLYGDERKFFVLMMHDEDMMDAERSFRKLPGVHPNAQLQAEVLQGRIFTATPKFYEATYRNLPTTNAVSDKVKEEIYLQLHEMFGGKKRRIGI